MYKKISASALGMTIIISLILALLTGFFVMRQHIVTIQIHRYQNKENLIHNSRSGLEILLSKAHSIQYNEWHKTPLFHETKDSVSLFRMKWGLYEMIFSKAENKNDQKTTAAIIGSKRKNENSYALYCADHGKKIIVGKHTSIRGRLAIPNEGIALNTEAQALTYLDNSVTGPKVNSLMELPTIDRMITDPLLQQLYSFTNKKDTLIGIERLLEDSLNVNFGDQTYYLSTSENLILQNCFLKGQIIISSTSRVDILNNCNIDGVIIVAPEIHISSGVHGNGQFYSTRVITVAENTQLDYPTCIVLLPPQKNIETATKYIHIKENVSIQGFIGLLENTTKSDNKSYIEINDGFKMEGEIYSSTNLQLNGIVHGTVWANRLFIKNDQGFFENQIANTNICCACLPEFFVHTLIWNNNSNYILRWL